MSPSRSSVVTRHRIPIIAGLVAFLLLVAGGGAFAAWTASVTGTGTVATRAVSVTQAGFPALAATYLPNSLSSTGVVTVTNTGQQAGTATLGISAAQPLAASLPITVWPVATAGACTPGATVPGGAVSGTWASPPSITATLAAGASTLFCVRTSIPDWKPLAVAGGAQSTTPQLSVSLNADGWVATTAATTTTLQTAGMYPLAPNFFDPTKSRWFTVRAKADNNTCLDVSGGGTSAANTAVISWGCHTASNQRWEFIPVAGTVQNLVTIRPRSGLGLRIASTAGGVQRIVTASTAVSQQWYVQQFDATTFQFVNAETGMCLNLRTGSSAADMATVTCDTSTARITLTREPLTFSATGTGGSATVTIGFGSEAPGAVSVQRLSGTTWTTIATTAANATSVTFNRNTYVTNNATTTYRIVNSGNDVLWDGIQITRAGNTVTAVAGIG